MLKRIMKRAHELAKKMEGDYQARLSLALKLAWKEERLMGNEMSNEERYNSWYRRDKEYNQTFYELAKRDREEWPEKSVEEIKRLLIEGNFGIIKKDRRAVMSFYNDDTVEVINITEAASGLRVEGEAGFDGILEEDGIITGITVDEFVDIRDWAWENLEEVEVD